MQNLAIIFFLLMTPALFSMSQDSGDFHDLPISQEEKNTALLIAINNTASLEDVQRAIERGADVNYQPKCGALCPLESALWHCNFDVADFLVEKGGAYSQICHSLWRI